MENAASEGLQKYSNDMVLKFFRAYATILQGKILNTKLLKIQDFDLTLDFLLNLYSSQESNPFTQLLLPESWSQI